MNQVILDDLENIKNRDIPWEKIRGKTVLISGAYGMLASYMTFILIHLNEKYDYNIQIIALVRSCEKAAKRFGEFIDREYFKIKTDLLDAPISIEEHIDYIIHAASFASPQYYAVCPVDVAKPNIIGTYNLLELAREKNVEGFLLFSTGDVYGVVVEGERVTEQSLGTIDPLDIHSCYSESKRMAETLCNCYYHQYGVPIFLARIWHTYGPTMDIYNDPRVFSSFMKNIMEGEDIEIKSDGSGKRTFCYIADATAAFFSILLKGKPGEAYNVCNTQQYTSIRELAEILVDIRKDISLSVTWKERPTDENYTENTSIGKIAPSDDKLRQLGWAPFFDISKGFERVYKYLLDEKGGQFNES